MDLLLDSLARQGREGGQARVWRVLGVLASGGMIARNFRNPRGLGAVPARGLPRSLFFWLMDPDDLRRRLDEEGRFFAESAARYRAYANAKDRGEFGDSPQVRSMRVRIEAGVRLYQALADWAEWAKTVSPPSTPRDISADQ